MRKLRVHNMKKSAAHEKIKRQSKAKPAPTVAVVVVVINEVLTLDWTYFSLSGFEVADGQQKALLSTIAKLTEASKKN